MFFRSDGRQAAQVQKYQPARVGQQHDVMRRATPPPTHPRHPLSPPVTPTSPPAAPLPRTLLDSFLPIITAFSTFMWPLKKNGF